MTKLPGVNYKMIFYNKFNKDKKFYIKKIF